MPLGMIGEKIGMTQVFDEKGLAVPVTVLQMGPNPVLQIRTMERDGYEAVQLGFKDKSRKKAIRAERGHVASDLESNRRKKKREAGVVILPKANVEPQRYIREFRTEGQTLTLAVGDKVLVADTFKDIKAVDVIGQTKGRGTAGVIKRHNFGGLRHSHGVKKGSRQRGSISSNASNRGSGRPKKGIRMAGRLGNDRVTVRNLEVIKIDVEKNLLLVRGAVPGFNGAMVMVRPTNKKG